MDKTKEELILDYINNIVEAEHGKRAVMSSTLRSLDLDSFGYTILMIDLDNEYKYFKDVEAGTDPFETIDWENMTIKEVIAKCM